MLEQSFPPEVRLLQRSEFDAVFSASEQKSIDKCFTVLGRFSVQAQNTKSARIGLVVPKKNIRKANVRNRIKRLIRESFRRNRKLIHHLDLVVIARSDAGKLPKQIVQQSLQKHWEKFQK